MCVRRSDVLGKYRRFVSCRGWSSRNKTSFTKIFKCRLISYISLTPSATSSWILLMIFSSRSWEIPATFKKQSWNTMMYFWCDNFPAASIPWNLFHDFTELNRYIFKSKTSRRLWGHSRDKVNVHCSNGSCDLSSCVTPTRSRDSLQFRTRHHSIRSAVLAEKCCYSWNFYQYCHFHFYHSFIKILIIFYHINQLGKADLSVVFDSRSGMPIERSN